MGASILIVEDDPNTREGYVQLLEAEGFDAVGMANPLEAVTAAIADPPAAIVTDISLPGMSGFDLAEILRRERHTRGVPVLGLTGNWSTEVSARASISGMAAVLMKPCMPAHLLAELRRVLNRPGAP